MPRLASPGRPRGPSRRRRASWRVRGIERHPGEPASEAVATIDRRSASAAPRAARAEDDAVEIGADDAPVLLVPGLGTGPMSRSPATTPAFRQARSTPARPTPTQRDRRRRTRRRRRVQRTSRHRPARAAATIAAPIPERPPVTTGALNGTRTTLPTLRRDSTSACASSTSASGNSAPTTGRIRASAPELEQLARRGCDHVGRVAQESADVDALDADVSPDELRRLQLRPEPAGEADRDELA